MDAKRCSRCKQEKPTSEFSNCRSAPDGLAYYCRDCYSAIWLERKPRSKRAPRHKRQVYNSRSAANRYKVENTLTSDEWLTMLNGSDGKCHYCGEQVGIDALVIEHVKPMKKGGANSIDNVVPSCAFCNKSKSDKENPLYVRFIKARYALKKLDGKISLDTQYKRNWWKRLVESLTQ